MRAAAGVLVVAALAVPAVAAEAPHVLDQAGDAHRLHAGQSATAPVAPASDAALDVVEVRFTATRTGTRVAFTVSGRPDLDRASYYVGFTRPGCTGEIELGRAPAPWFRLLCSGRYTDALLRAAVVRGSTAVVEVPYAVLPRGVVLQAPFAHVDTDDDVLYEADRSAPGRDVVVGR